VTEASLRGAYQDRALQAGLSGEPDWWFDARAAAAGDQEWLLAVQLTHGAVSRELLALAIKQFRRDAESLSPKDLQGLLAAATNGGRQGFDAVLCTRKGGERKPISLSWGRDTE
jgi:hypothetical protein